MHFAIMALSLSEISTKLKSPPIAAPINIFGTTTRHESRYRSDIFIFDCREGPVISLVDLHL